MNKEEVIQTLSIRSYLGGKGHTFKSVNGEVLTKCPLHDDNNPSFRINEDRRVWYCFPCKQGGNVIDLRMQIEHIERHVGPRSACVTAFVPNPRLAPSRAADYVDV